MSNAHAAAAVSAAPVRDTSLDIDVLRALLRLARRQTPPTMEQLVVRVGAEPEAVRRSLVALARNGLVQRTPGGLRLSLPGLAVAVAYAQRPATPASRVARSRPSIAASASAQAVEAPARRRAA